MIYIPKKDFEGPEEEPEFKVNFYLPRRDHLVRELIATEVSYESKESKLENKIKLSLYDSGPTTISEFKNWANSNNKLIATSPQVYSYLKQIVDENNTEEIDKMRKLLETRILLLTDTAIHYQTSSQQSKAVHGSVNPYERKLGTPCNERGFPHYKGNHPEFIRSLLDTQDNLEDIQKVFERIKGDSNIEVWTYQSSENAITQGGFFAKDNNLQILADIKDNETGRIMLVE
jgi:hypothetical protein